MGGRGTSGPTQPRLGVVTTLLPFQRALARLEQLIRARMPVALQGEDGTGISTVVAHILRGCGPGPILRLDPERHGGNAAAFSKQLQTLVSGSHGLRPAAVVFEHLEYLPFGLQREVFDVIEAILTEVAVARSNVAELPQVIVVIRERDGGQAGLGLHPAIVATITGATLRIPPLRERRPDIRLLAQLFLVRWSRRRKEFKVFSPEALAVLERRRWPGNLRELQSVVRNAVLVATGDTIRASDLGPEGPHPSGQGPTPPPGGLPAATLPGANDPLVARGGLNPDGLAQALRTTDGDVRRTATLVGYSPRWVHKKINEFGLRGVLEEIRADLRAGPDDGD